MGVWPLGLNLMKVNLERRVVAGFAAVGVIGALLCGLAFHTIRQLTLHSRGVLHTYEVLAETTRSLNCMQDVESASRGFALSGAESFLAPFDTSVADLDRIHAGLRDLVADNPQQLKRVLAMTETAATRLESSRELIDIRKRQGLGAAAERVAGGAGKELMERYRGQIAEIRLVEENLLARRMEAARDSMHQTAWLLCILGLGLLALLVAMCVAVLGDLTRRRKAEGAAREAEAFLHSLIENLPLMVFTKEAKDMRFVQFNRAGEELLGITREALMGKSDYDLFPKEKADFFVAKDREVLAGGKLLDIAEEEIQTRGRGRIMLHTRKVPVLDGAGRPKYLLGISEDITERRRMEASLRESEVRFRQLYHEAPCGYHSLDGAGVYVEINNTELKWLGYTREEVIGKMALTDLVSPESAETFRRHFPRFKRDGFVNDLEFDFIRKDGTSFPVILSATAVTDASGQFQYSRSTMFNISELRRAQDALKESERRLQDVLDNAAVMAFVKNLDGAYTFSNQAFERAYGMNRGELLGHTAAELFSTELAAKLDEGDRRVAAGETVTSEEVIPHKDGVRTHLTVKFPLQTMQGQIYGVCGISSEITERKKMEEAIRALNDDLVKHASRVESVNKELEAFSYSASHDLRAPLRSIDGFSQVLLEDYADNLDEVGRSHLGRIRRATQRMADLIDDLTKLARVARHDLAREQVSLTAMANAVLDELRQRDPGRQVETVVEADLTVLGDPQLLRIALDNLIGNAWKFTSRTPSPRIEVGRRTRDNGPTFFVKDNGAGFEMKYAERLFSPFFRLHGNDEFPGTGVGLATVQRIISRHEGRVWAEAAVDRGATFYFTL